MSKRRSESEGEDVWRALANQHRRQILDLLHSGPLTTGQLAEAVPEVSRYAVMQHLGVLVDTGLVVVRRQGRQRVNHLNPVPLRRWYERWVVPLADRSAAELLSLQRTITDSKGTSAMPLTEDTTHDTSHDHRTVRAVHIEAELRFHAEPARVFRALTEDTLAWFPFTYGEDRVKSIVMEPRVGGAHYEDWGDGTGHLYGHVTVFDPPYRLALRGRIMPGTILDTEYTITPDGDHAVLSMAKVAIGPMTEDEAGSVHTYGNIARFEDALRAVIEA